MLRFLSLATFGVGFYYLWYGSDTTTEMVAFGAMGLALLFEWVGPD
jgi:hypothetical protein